MDAIKPKERKLHLIIIKWLIITLVIGLILYFGTLPVRSRLSSRYLQKGDGHLLEKKYVTADLDYQKALILSPKNEQARSRRELTDKISKNILEVEPFLLEKDQADSLELLEKSKAVPRNETEAVLLSKELIENGEYQLAIIPANTAVEMDQSYRDAWLYLGIAYLKAAERLEVKSSIRREYRESARTYLSKAKELDPTYEPTLQFLGEMES